MQKYLLNLMGTSCAGKSTFAKAFFEKHKGTIRITSDTIKRFISGYNGDLQDREKTIRMTLGLVETCMKEGDSIILEPHSKAGLSELAEKYGYTVIMIYMEAPFSVLQQRFTTRITDYQKSGSEVFINTSMERFTEIYQAYCDIDKSDATHIFDSSIMSIEDMMSTITSTMEKDTD